MKIPLCHPSGTEMKSEEIYRTTNQSIGRVIRDNVDYGIIYLLDDRYSKGHYKDNLSGWALKIEDISTFKSIDSTQI